jgi:hypothetical protein
VGRIRETDRGRGRSVHAYILDNEPSLWNITHRDVHPNPTTYDELLERTIAYAAAIRRADPEATIAGPAEWGWNGYLYSAEDREVGFRRRPDRRSHGDVPLVPWYLRTLREHEQRTGTRVLDLLDLHYYPMGNAIGSGSEGATDPATSALRIRSTRSLWDPTYVDESWVKQPVRLLPRMREWIQENHPGLGISIGEWGFGAEHHMSGGLAAAEALGRFGTEGLTSAYYWPTPAENSPAYWAFRAYRNFDGNGGHFLDRSVPVRVQGELASMFASRDPEGRHLVAVLLNFSPRSELKAHVALDGCGSVATSRAFTYVGGEAGFASLPAPPSAGAVALSLPGYSITVLDLTLAASPP